MVWINQSAGLVVHKPGGGVLGKNGMGKNQRGWKYCDGPAYIFSVSRDPSDANHVFAKNIAKFKSYYSKNMICFQNLLLGRYSFVSKQNRFMEFDWPCKASICPEKLFSEKQSCFFVLFLLIAQWQKNFIDFFWCCHFYMRIP